MLHIAGVASEVGRATIFLQVVISFSDQPPTCTMSQTQPAEFLLHFAETGDLQSSAERLGKAVEKEVEIVPAGATTALKYFDYRHAAYVETVQKYESFYKDVSSLLSHFTGY